MSEAEEKWWRDEEDGDLEFEVSSVPAPRRFDGAEHGIPWWNKVDFIFHWPDKGELWLVEVKDPDNASKKGDPQTLIKEFQQNELIYRKLAPKAKDSFLYLFLQDQLPENTRIIYLVLFACAELSSKRGREASHFLNATKEIKKALGLPGPHGNPWPKGKLYIDSCLIMSLSQWQNHPVGQKLRVERVSARP